MSLGIQIMRASFFRTALIIVAIYVAFRPFGVLAEFACSADVSYSWGKSAAEAAPQPPAATTRGKADPAPLKPQGAPSEPKPIIVRIAAVQRAGFDEAGAKVNLQLEVDRQKARASEQCKRDHESLGDCMATKLSARASTLNSLGFSARAELEKALTKECAAQQGVCLSVESSEPQCRPYGSTKPGDQAGGGKSPAKKPESKKK